MTSGLDTWTDGPTRAAIVDFVARVSDEDGPDFVEPAARVAVFDNDGTLWCEKPMPIQLDFTVRRLAEMARDDPALQQQQPWKAAYEGDLHWMGAAMVKHYHGDDEDIRALMGAVTRAFDTVTVEEYDARVRAFFLDGGPPDAGAALPVVRIRPDGGAPPLPGGPRVHQLHRLRRRPGLHAPRRRRAVRGAPGAGDRQRAGPDVRRRQR